MREKMKAVDQRRREKAKNRVGRKNRTKEEEEVKKKIKRKQRRREAYLVEDGQRESTEAPKQQDSRWRH